MYTDPKNKKYFKAGGPGENRKDTRPASRAGEDKPRRDSRGPSQDSKVDTRPVNRGSDSRGFSQEKRDDTRPASRGSQVRPRREAFTPSRDEDKGGRDPAFEQAVEKERIPSDDRLEGRNPVLEALRAGRTINKLWVVKPEGGRIDPTMARIVTMARDKGVYYTEVPRITLDQMSETHNHQGVIAQCASHDYMEIEEIIRLAAEKGEAPFLLMLDELKDAYNLGSILRIADAAGVHGVIIPKHRSIGLDSMVAKASAGAIEYVPVARVTNLSQTITSLKEQGFWVAGTDAEGTVPYDKADYKGPLLIVIGSEGEGMAKNIREKCDFLLSIPMSGHVNSLNAAVAAGIVVFTAKRLRS